jgi:hypothetical protein
MPPVPLTLRRLPLVLAAAAALALPAASASAAPAAHVMPAAAKTAAFDAQMRQLWEDHVQWTRMVIIDFAAGLPSLKASEARLLRNQADIGNAIKPFYGAAAGKALTQLLRTHILEAVPVLVAAKAGDRTKLAAAQKTWRANAGQIAAFLAKANPEHWPLAEMRAMMLTHLDLTTREAAARLQGKWAADVAAYDAVRREILAMSDMLSAGIEAQFPEQF